MKTISAVPAMLLGAAIAFSPALGMAQPPTPSLQTTSINKKHSKKKHHKKKGKKGMNKM